MVATLARLLDDPMCGVLTLAKHVSRFAPKRAPEFLCALFTVLLTSDLAGAAIA